MKDLYTGRADFLAVAWLMPFWLSMPNCYGRQYYYWVDSFMKPAQLGWLNWNLAASALCPELQDELVKRYGGGL